MATFTDLLRKPGAKPMMAAGMIGRLPMGVVGLGITLLVVGNTGSYALAGSISATQTIMMALVAPYGSRMSDRIGQSRALPRLLVANVGSLLALTLAVQFGWPIPLWYLFAGLAGASVPMLGSMTRARWVALTRSGPERSSAFAVESVADEAAFVVGPVLASALALAFFPAAAVLVGLTTALIGGLWLASQRATEPAPALRSASRGGHVMTYRGMGTLLVMMLALGGVFGTLHVSTVAYAQERDPALTGLLLGAFSFGSLVSGVMLGSRARTWTLTSQVRTGVATLAVFLLPLPFIANPALFAPMAFLAGLSVSVVMIGSFGLVERLVPEGRLTESLSTTAAGISLGLAGSSTAAGLIIDSYGAQPALGLAGGFATIAGTIFWSRARLMLLREATADTAGDERETAGAPLAHASA